MAATGTVTINFVGDVSRLRGALGEAETGLAGFSQRMEDTGKRLMGIGTRLTLGITAPLLILGKTAFDAASDLNESLNKVDVVFGKSAGEIRKWSESAAVSMGMARQQALESAGTFGAMFKAMGISVPTAKDMSKTLVQLAADMASFNNQNPEDMLIALRSGLAGEVEPLRKFGVDLSAAAVEQRALTMTGKESVEQLTMQEKVMARYSIILEQTKDQQGDFARTADGAANKQRILKAQFQDSAAALGTSLIPIMQQLMGVVQRVADWFGQLDPKVQKIIVIAGIAVFAIGPLVGALGALATVIGVIISPIGLVVLAIAALIAIVVVMWVKWDEIWTLIKGHPAIAILVGMLAWPVTGLFILIGALKWLWENWSDIWPKIQGVLQGVWDVIGPIFNAWWEAVQKIIDILQWLWDRAKEAFNGVRDAAMTLWEAIDGPLLWLYNRLRDIVSIATKVKGALDDVPGLGGGGVPGGIVPDSVPYIGKFDTGGMIPGPVGRPYWAVVHGGEEVLTPAQQAARASTAASGGTIVIPLYLDGRVVTEVVVANLNRAGGPQISQRAVA